MIQDKSNPNDHPPHEYEAVNINLWVFRTFKYNKAWITKFITVSRCNLKRSQDPQPRYYCSFSKNINSPSMLDLIYQRTLFNGGWAVLDILCWLIHWLIHRLILKRFRNNFRVYLERAHPAFLTTIVVLVLTF